MEVGVTPSTSPVTFGGGGGGHWWGRQSTTLGGPCHPPTGACLCCRLVLYGVSFPLQMAAGAMEVGVTPSILPCSRTALFML